jgi:hypothetical protein
MALKDKIKNLFCIEITPKKIALATVFIAFSVYMTWEDIQTTQAIRQNWLDVSLLVSRVRMENEKVVATPEFKTMLWKRFNSLPFTTFLPSYSPDYLYGRLFARLEQGQRPGQNKDEYTRELDSLLDQARDSLHSFGDKKVN